MITKTRLQSAGERFVLGCALMLMALCVATLCVAQEHDAEPEEAMWQEHPNHLSVLLAVADIHFRRGFAVQVGPGVELIDGEAGEEDEDEFIVRLGALYEFENGRFTVSPQLHLDKARHAETWVFGVALGFGF